MPRSSECSASGVSTALSVNGAGRRGGRSRLPSVAAFATAQSVIASEWNLADTARAHLPRAADNAAPAAVERVKGSVGANAVAERPTSRARAARPGTAVRRRSPADVAARAAVVRVRAEVDAGIAAGCQSGRARTAGPLVAVRGRPAADVAACAAVVRVPAEIDAGIAAGRQSERARTACPLIAVRGRSAADVAAGAAVVRVGEHRDARPAAPDGPGDAGVHAHAGDARRLFIGAGLAGVPAAAAVADVVGEVPAGVAGPAGPAEAAGGAGTRPARRQAGVLLTLVRAPAERLARVHPPGLTGAPGRPHPSEGGVFRNRSRGLIRGSY